MIASAAIPTRRLAASVASMAPRSPGTASLLPFVSARYALGVAVLESHVERTDEFERRHGRLEALVAELRERTAQVAAGGGERAVERHRSPGKLLARERVDRLLRPGAAFLELGALAAWDVYGGEAPVARLGPRIRVV